MTGLDPPFVSAGLSSTICPNCRRTSYHPEDVERRYCTLCGHHDGSGGGMPRLAALLKPREAR
jgi:hypothetical protein